MKEIGNVPYWKQTGGKFGIFIGLALLGLGGYYLAPILTTIAWNLQNMIIAGVSLFAVSWVVINPDTRLVAFYIYKTIINGLLGLVFKMNPWIAAEEDINSMINEREKILEISKDVEAKNISLKDKIAEKRDESERLVGRIQIAQSKGLMNEVGNCTRQIGRNDLFFTKIGALQSSLEQLSNHMDKQYDEAKYKIEDAQSELQSNKDLYESATLGQKAMAAGLRLFKGDPRKKMMADQQMERLKMDIATKLASMKKDLRLSNQFMESIDLDNATFEAKGLELLTIHAQTGAMPVTKHAASKLLDLNN